MDKDILARTGRTVRVDQDRKKEQERRSCCYCLSGWVFLGSLNHDAEEIVESIRCRRCGGTSRING